MQWKFFFGASVLTAAMLLPYAGTTPVVAGVVLAAIVQWGSSRIGRGPP
jgi:hypothetical protein